MSFIAEYNRLNPNDKTSYPTLIRKRKLCTAKGTSALITKYGHPGKVYYPDMEKYYPIFKNFYLSPLRLSAETARQYTALQLNLPLKNFPSGMTFRRRLYKEFPKEVIKSIRSELCF